MLRISLKDAMTEVLYDKNRKYAKQYRPRLGLLRIFRALRRQPLPSPPSVMTAVVDIRRPQILRSLLIGYPSYARNRACTLPSPSPIHYVMAEIVPAIQLATHVKSSTLYGRSYSLKSKFFRLDGLLHIIITTQKIYREQYGEYPYCQGIKG